MKTRTLSGLGLAGAGALALGAQEVRADTFEITMVLFSFMYDGNSNLDIDLTIQPGDTIKWTWISGLHNVVSGMPGDKDEGELFFSGEPVFAPNEFEFTFNDPGVYFFHCDEHENFGMISFVTVEGGCTADVNGDGVLNILDFIAFQNAFLKMDAIADCNEDGVFNILDFVCFQNVFGKGCP